LLADFTFGNKLSPESCDTIVHINFVVNLTRSVRNGFLNFGSVSGLKKTSVSVRFRFC